MALQWGSNGHNTGIRVVNIAGMQQKFSDWWWLDSTYSAITWFTWLMVYMVGWHFDFEYIDNILIISV